MQLKQFIQDHKEEIDYVIQKSFRPAKITNAEREEWVMNDETLYLWARLEEVKI